MYVGSKQGCGCDIRFYWNWRTQLRGPDASHASRKGLEIGRRISSSNASDTLTLHMTLLYHGSRASVDHIQYCTSSARPQYSCHQVACNHYIPRSISEGAHFHFTTDRGHTTYTKAKCNDNVQVTAWDSELSQVTVHPLAMAHC